MARVRRTTGSTDNITSVDVKDFTNMATYRLRVKYEHDPRSLWRDIVVSNTSA